MIPGPTHELGPESIVAINRWRERTLLKGELPHRAFVRQVVIAVLAGIGGDPILELGCGKYPLQPELGARDYVGCDIDPEAIAHCRDMGLVVSTLGADILDRASELSVIAALFTFQFPLSAAVEDLLARSGDACVALLNLPTKDDRLLSERMEMFSRAGMEVTRIELADAHDRLLIAGRPAAAARRRTAVSIAREVIDRSHTARPNRFG